MTGRVALTRAVQLVWIDIVYAALNKLLSLQRLFGCFGAHAVRLAFCLPRLAYVSLKQTAFCFDLFLLRGAVTGLRPKPRRRECGSQSIMRSDCRQMPIEVLSRCFRCVSAHFLRAVSGLFVDSAVRDTERGYDLLDAA